MFQDKEEELKRLEEALLAEEETEEEQEISQPQDATMVFQPVAEPAGVSPRKVYNTDVLDTDLDDFSRRVERPKGEGLTGLVILAILLTAGVVCAVIWWVLRLRGII